LSSTSNAFVKIPHKTCLQTKRVAHSLLLDDGEHVALDLLVGDEHGDVPGGETHEVRDEALVEGAEAVGLEGARNAVNHTCVLASHHSGLGDIERRPKDASSEASHGSAKDMQGHAITHTCVLQDHLLVLIVGGDFGSVDHRVTEDVGDDTDPEATEAASLIGLTVAVDGAIVQLGL
jgi:hypothetical protein